MVLHIRHSVLSRSADTFYQGLATVWPNASTTGPRIATTPASSGNKTGLQSGKLFTGAVYPANGTVFEDCAFTGNGVITGDGTTFTVSYCSFAGNGNDWLILGNANISYCEFSNSLDAIKPQGSGWTISRCYIHSPYTTGDSHNDGIQASGGHSNCIVEENYITWVDTSEVFFHTVFGSVSNCIIRHNWVGGSDMPIRVNGTSGGCSVYENVILEGDHGYMTLTDGAAVAHYGNIDAITGASVD
jgi:hypothetical protein